MCVSDEEFEFMLFFHDFLKYMEKIMYLPIKNFKEYMAMIWKKK